MRDPDDVPTATLTLQLGAVLLCTDRKPLWAVYGPDVDLDRHEKYLDILRLGGNAAALRRIHDEKADPLALGVNLFMAGIGALWRWSPLAVPLAGVAVWQLLKRTKPSTRERATAVVAEMFARYGQLLVMMNEATEAFRSAAAPTPGWGKPAEVLAPEAVLTRACLHTLARSASSDRSAAELTGQLPQLPVAQGEAKVRTTLRRDATAFHQPYKGRFQVGRPGQPWVGAVRFGAAPVCR